MLKRNHLIKISSRIPAWSFPVTTLFSRRWWLSTLLVLIGMAILIRLGFWQLDRLEQRRARNAELAHQLALPPLSLTDSASLPHDLANLKTRQATAEGEFDFARQVALTYQNWHSSPGIHLITPLVIEGSGQAVLVDRGWIPQTDASPKQWAQFNEPGSVTVTGFIHLSETLPQNTTGGEQDSQSADETFQTEWFRVDIAAIESQLPYELLPIYIQQSPPAGRQDSLPYQADPEFDLSDGPHLGYAIQWYIFALILGGGYVGYVNKAISKNSP